MRVFCQSYDVKCNFNGNFLCKNSTNFAAKYSIVTIACKMLFTTTRGAEIIAFYFKENSNFYQSSVSILCLFLNDFKIHTMRSLRVEYRTSQCWCVTSCCRRGFRRALQLAARLRRRSASRCRCQTTSGSDDSAHRKVSCSCSTPSSMTSTCLAKPRRSVSNRCVT